MRIRIAIEINPRRARLFRDSLQHAQRISFPNDQPASLAAQVAVERLKTSAEKRLARVTAPVTRRLPIACDVEGHDLVLGGDGGVQRAIVCEAEVAPEPMDGDAHQLSLHYECR